LKRENVLDKTVENNGGTNIRAYALNTIIEILENGAYQDKAVHSTLDSGIIKDKRDRAFFSRLCVGTVERAVTLDYIINCFSSVKTGKMKPAIRNILRMSVYQVFYMDSVPDAATCNEAVLLARKRGFKGLCGFVNGILRKIIREKENIRYPAKDKDGFIKYASIKYSMPEWITEKFCKEYGEEITEKILEAFLNEDKKNSVRCNISKAEVPVIKKLLEADGVTVHNGRLYNYALNISGYDKLTQLRAFKEGLVQVQDESSMLSAAIAGIKENNIVLDICAAPGGKTLHAADILNGTGKVISCDISESKTKLIQENTRRAGFNNIDIYGNDALVYKEEWKEIADIVIADLPCSGLGVTGRKCDIKYKTSLDAIRELQVLQRKILGIAGKYVKPGGRLIYSTCTITPEENTDNARWITDSLPFKAVPIEELLPECLEGITGKDGYLQVLPYMAGTDGYFVALFEKSL